MGGTSLGSKAWKLLQRNGLGATLRYRAWYVRERSRSGPDEYDRRHGVDTTGKIPLAELAIDSPHATHGCRYEPIHPYAFARMLASVPGSLEPFTFVDLGSGKGRALLLASEHPFQKIVGVEFAPELHQAALVNLQRYRSRSQRCRRLEAVLGDATAFPLPAGPLVIHLYNPFGAPVMARVIANLEASLRDDPRPAYLLYFNPVCRVLLDGSPELDAIHEEAAFVVYRARRVIAVAA